MEGTPHVHDGEDAVVTTAPKASDYHPAVIEQNWKDVLLLLIGFRFINALCIATFFQPDEYFQSLEPAWDIAFGSQSGAWITWEWQHQLRPSLHPAMFAAAYLILDKLMIFLSCLPQFRAIILVVLPKVLQGLFAAFGDYFTWQFAERIYGCGGNIAWTALLMTLLSPWQWFCSTRTLSNSLEVVLTIAALYFWPWELCGDLNNEYLSSIRSTSRRSASNEKQSTSRQQRVFRTSEDIARLRLCLVLAAIACILRPTNLLVWVSLVTTSATRIGFAGVSHTMLSDLLIFLREVVLCGTAVISVSAVSDRFYFGMWTFPPYQWLNFNITQSLAVFYGANDWHYYLSQGLPLLLTTYLPFAVVALWSSSSISSSALSPLVTNIRFDLTFMVLAMAATLSLISHKEVRFIYPLLPSLHVLTAPHILSFFNATPLISAATNAYVDAPISAKSWRLYLFIALVIVNITIGLYTTQVHQRGVIDVLAFVRHEYEELHLTQEGLPLPSPNTDEKINGRYSGHDPDEMFVAFLMPCHSTPWRSHLIYPNLHAWALTCEPPLHIPANTPERAAYRDEADRFYDDPDSFLKREVNTEERPWPRYVVGFEGIEPALKNHCEAQMPGWTIRERWSGFNSHWHDDKRRMGKVVVWQFIDGSESGGRDQR